jgi:hypothetical protein
MMLTGKNKVLGEKRTASDAVSTTELFACCGIIAS